MQKEDWKKKFPKEERRKTRAISFPTRTLAEKADPFEDKSGWKKYIGYAITVAGVIWLMVEIHDRGFERGKEAAVKDIPAEYAATKQSLVISEDKNIELLSENKALKEEVKMSNNKLEEINQSILKHPQETQQNASSVLVDITPESHIIDEDDSGEYFNNELVISVINVDTAETDIDTTTISASVATSTPKTFTDLKVGSKVVYMTERITYEILISTIKYSSQVEIKVVKLINKD